MAGRGVCHGDAAPWNLLATEDGFVLVDWEEAGPAPSEAWDLCHWLVQTHCLLGRPRAEEVLMALEGEGPLGRTARVFADAAALDLGSVPNAMLRYLERTTASIDRSREDGLRGWAGRRALRLALARLLGESNSSGRSRI